MTVFRNRNESEQQGAGSVESILLSILDAINSGSSNGATESTLQDVKDCLSIIDGNTQDVNRSTKFLRSDCVGSGVTYVGYAEPGTTDIDSVWAIVRYTETGCDAVAEWADGNNDYDNVWDDRLTLTYS